MILTKNLIQNSQGQPTLLSITKFLDDYSITLTGTENSAKLKILMQKNYDLNYKVYKSLPQSSHEDILAFSIVDPRVSTLRNVAKQLEKSLIYTDTSQIDLDIHTQVSKLTWKATKQSRAKLLARSIDLMIETKITKNEKVSPLAASNLM